MSCSVTPSTAQADRPLVIALHCSGSSGRQWKPLADYLGERCTVVAPDLIGCATVGHWSGETAFSLDDEARGIIGAIDGWPGPVHLVGHSYGGGVALQIAVRRPSRVASLSVYEPSAFHLLAAMGPKGTAALREIKAVASAVQDGMLTGSYRAAARHFVDYWNGAGAWDRMRPHSQQDVLQYLPKAVLDFAALFGGAMDWDAFRRLDVPTLVLRGETAPRPTARIAEGLRDAARHGRYQVVPGAGHMGPLSHPELVAKAIGDHILQALTLPSLAAAA